MCDAASEKAPEKALSWATAGPSVGKPACVSFEPASTVSQLTSGCAPAATEAMAAAASVSWLLAGLPLFGAFQLPPAPAPPPPPLGWPPGIRPACMRRSLNSGYERANGCILSGEPAAMANAKAALAARSRPTLPLATPMPHLPSWGHVAMPKQLSLRPAACKAAPTSGNCSQSGSCTSWTSEPMSFTQSWRMLWELLKRGAALS
mmetsp:Transcript_26166/g.59500  ORF Transcript_26166/g.59500 Transcript_26166/m.59500 type:complete len:205 (-) Transcript_26166:143-757(-)